MSLSVKDASGATQIVNTLPALGQAAAAASLPVALAADGNHAKASDITSLSTAISGALAPSGGLPVVLQGTVAVTQSGTWTVGLSPGATVALAGGNTVALKVDGSAATQPVSGTVTIGSMPALPAGANKIGSVDVASLPVTAAKDASLVTLDNDLNAGLGGDGASPPAIAGTGVRGWLRAIYEKVAGTLAVSGTVTANLGALNGAATAAAQGTGNTSLASIDGKVPAKGQAAMAGSTPVTIASDQPALPVSPAQAANLATGQVSVGATATQIVAARTGRRQVVIIQEGTTLVRLGGSGVTLTTGVPLPGTAYSVFTVDGGAAVYGIVASGSQTVSFVEVY